MGRPVTCARKGGGKLMMAGAVACVVGGACRADVVYVSGSAIGAADGSSWTDAFTDLQAGLAAAEPGDQVWVGAGTYRASPAPGLPGSSRAASFFLKTGVGVYGGFAGGEASLEERDWVENLTVLSGDLAGDDAPGFVNTEENSYQVVVALNVDDTAVLDGFTVSGGRADGEGLGAVPESKDQGSGLNVYFASPTVRNCTFSGNWSLNHGSVNDHGDDATFTDCAWRWNHSAGFGAGLYIHHHSATTAVGCAFEGNTAVMEGAGAYTRSEHGASFTWCVFVGNEANLGAGLYHAEMSATRVTECAFAKNTAALGGGGMYANVASPTVERCTFAGNSAALDSEKGGGGAGGSGGGGIWSAGGTLTLTACLFFENRASLGGGVYTGDECAATIVDCAFTRNRAHEAGGLYNLASVVLVEGCEFTGNIADGTVFPVGGGMTNYFNNTVVRGCTFDGNSALLGGGGVYNEGPNPITITGCVFTRNTAFRDNAGWGGAMMNSYFSLTNVHGCAFVGNSANAGGAVFNLVLAGPTLTGCSFAGNTAAGEGDLGGGGAVYNLDGTTTALANCVAWGNAPEQIAGHPPTVRYSCVEGGFEGEGNVSGDPRFERLPDAGADGVWGTEDDELGDLRVRGGSSCIDAGDNGAVPEGETVDLDGGERFVDDLGTPDTGLGTPPVVDMGAYEFGGTSCRGDFDGDGALNSDDYFAFLAAFFKGDADFDGDGVTDSDDYFGFLAAYFAGCR